MASTYKNLTAALRAPFWKRFQLGATLPDSIDHSYDNAFTIKWRNAAGTADVSALTVNSSDQVQMPDGLVVGDAMTDTLILKGRVSTGTVAGSALVVDSATYTYGEGVELRYTIQTTWPTGNQFNGLYLRVQSDLDNASGGLRGAEIMGVANASAVSDLKGVFSSAYVKGDTAESIATIYGAHAEFTMDAGRANDLTISTEAAALLAKITGGKCAAYTGIHGIIIRSGDMDGASRTYGNGILLVDDSAMAGAITWTRGIKIGQACTADIEFQSGDVISNGADGVLTIGTAANALSLKLAADSPLLDSNGNELIKFVATGSALNEITITNTATGVMPLISSSGEAGIGLRISSDGAGSVTLQTGGGSLTQVQVLSTADAVDYITLTGAAASGTPEITVAGTDAAIPIRIAGKGTGAIYLGQSGCQGIALYDSSPLLDANNNELFKFTATGSAVNEFTVANAATGGSPTLSVTGDDANVSMKLEGKAGGYVRAGVRTWTTESGDTIGFHTAPAQGATTTGDVYGARITPRCADTFGCASIIGALVEPILKGTSGNLSGDVLGLKLQVTDENAAGRTIGGTVVVGGRLWHQLAAHTITGADVVGFDFQAHGGATQWTAALKFAAATGLAAIHGGAGAALPADVGWIRVKVGATYYKLPCYND